MKLKKQKHEQQKKNGNDLMSKGMDAHSKTLGPAGSATVAEQV